MQIHDRFIKTVAHLQRWPKVDLRRTLGRLPEGHKIHIVRENCKGVREGRLPGFILVHEDGREEHFDFRKSVSTLNGRDGIAKASWRTRFTFMEPAREGRLA